MKFQTEPREPANTHAGALAWAYQVMFDWVDTILTA